MKRLIQLVTHSVNKHAHIAFTLDYTKKALNTILHTNHIICQCSDWLFPYYLMVNGLQHNRGILTELQQTCCNITSWKHSKYTSL